MKINKIKLLNFKSYYSSNEIDLSVTDEKNVIIIYADSGFGKTTLLEAINWVLYGEHFLEKFNKNKKREDKLTITKWINETHLKEVIYSGKMGEMSVEINYEIENEKHVIINSLRFNAKSIDNIEIYAHDHILKKLPSGGTWITSTNLEVDVNRVLPRNIVDYFFFDAEKQSRLVMPSNQSLVQEAIYNVIGLKNLENAADNLSSVAKDYSRELGNIDLGEASILTKRKTELEENAIKDGENLELIKEEIKSLKELIDEIDIKLLGIPETEKYQIKIDALKTDKADLLSAKEQLELDLAKISFDSAPFIINDTLLDFQNDLNTLRESGKIPGTITLNLLNEIFEKNECICGIKLEDFITQKQNLEKLKTEISKRSDEKDKLIDIYHSLKMFISELNTRNPEEISKLIQKYDQLNEAIANVEEQIKINEEQIGDIDNTDIKELKENKDRFDQRRGELESDKGSLSSKMENDENELKEINNKLGNLVIQNEKAKKLQAYEKNARLTSEELKTIFSTFADKTKKEISEIAEEQWKKLIRSTKQLSFKIDDSFKFNIQDSLGRNAINDLSNGQKQGLVLSFVSAISAVSQKFPPYIIDMPFGRLGEESQIEASIFMPKVCKQLILLLNKRSEYNEATMGNLRPKCNKLIELEFDADNRITNIIQNKL